MYVAGKECMLRDKSVCLEEKEEEKKTKARTQRFQVLASGTFNFITDLSLKNLAVEVCDDFLYIFLNTCQ